MIPTEEQYLQLCRTYLQAGGGAYKTVTEIIKEWEAIRPKDDAEQADELAAVKQSRDDWRKDCYQHSMRSAELEKERDQLRDDAAEISKLQDEISDMKDSKVRLERSRDAWKENCSMLSSQVAAAEKERCELKAMLPEWIPVSESASASIEAYYLALSPRHGVCIYGRGGNEGDATHILPCSIIANLPKREAAPKPVDPQAEFLAWYDAASLDDRCEAAIYGWKAVVAKNGGPK